MHLGRVVAEGTAAQVLAAPRHRYARALALPACAATPPVTEGAAAGHGVACHRWRRAVAEAPEKVPA